MSPETSADSTLSAAHSKSLADIFTAYGESIVASDGAVVASVLQAIMKDDISNASAATPTDNDVNLSDAAKDRKPKTHNGDLCNLPAALAPLKDKPRWVLWRWEWRNKKWTKPPLQPNGRYASTDDDSTWHAYDEVINVFDGAFDGIGYVLGDDNIALDIDHCRDADTGEIHPWAVALVDKVKTYAEVSPSGTGLRIIGFGGGDEIHRKIAVPNANGVSCEFYRKAVRYVTVTGNKLGGSADALTDIQAVFDEAYAELSSQPDADEDGRDGEDELRRTLGDGGGDRYDGDRSRAFWFVVNGLLRRGHSRAKVEETLLSIRDNPIAEHIADQGRDPRAYVERQVEKAIQQASLTTDRNGRVLPTPTNVRIAMFKLGVTVHHDRFANRDLIDGLEGFGPELDDAAANRLWMTIDQQFGFRPSDELFFKVLRDSARRNEFHPVLNYLDGLKWDGVQRLDRWLTAYGGAEDSAYVRAIGALVLIAAVRRVRQPGCKFDELVVLEGEQGTERSTAVATLAVREEWFTDSLPLNAEGREAIEQLSGKWIVEAAELDGMKKADVERLKAFLSRRSDRGRPAYGRLQLELARQCVIIGTTNASKYLKDTTGNRRYWPVAIKKIELAALIRDVDQLWAEASVREATGVSIRLESHLWAAAAEAQGARLVEDPFLDILQAELGDIDVLSNAGGHTERIGVKIANTSVWEILDVRGGQRSQEMNRRMGDAMRRLGWKPTASAIRIDGKPTRGYTKGEEPWKQVVAWRQHDGLCFIGPVDGSDAMQRLQTLTRETAETPETGTSYTSPEMGARSAQEEVTPPILGKV